MVSSISSKKQTKTCPIVVKTNSFIRFWKNSRLDNFLSKSLGHARVVTSIIEWIYLCEKITYFHEYIYQSLYKIHNKKPLLTTLLNKNSWSHQSSWQQVLLIHLDDKLLEWGLKIQCLESLQCLQCTLQFSICIIISTQKILQVT